MNKIYNDLLPSVLVKADFIYDPEDEYVVTKTNSAGHDYAIFIIDKGPNEYNITLEKNGDVVDEISINRNDRWFSEVDAVFNKCGDKFDTERIAEVLEAFLA